MVNDNITQWRKPQYVKYTIKKLALLVTAIFLHSWNTRNWNDDHSKSAYDLAGFPVFLYSHYTLGLNLEEKNLAMFVFF